MGRGAYLKQLEIDLERWAALGLVGRDQFDALRANAGPPARHYSLSGMLFMLGTILIACAITIFIGANWQALPRVARLGILLALMWSAYGGAHILLQRERAVFAEGALLLGSVLFGAAIMLIGQMYHINAGWPNGVLLWACGMYLAAWAAPSRSCAVLAMILFCVWSGGITIGDDWVTHTPFLLALAAMIVLARSLNFHALAHLIVLAFLAWSVANGAVLADELPGAEFPFFIALMMTLALAMWLGGAIAPQFGARFGALIAGYGLFFLTLVVFTLQFAEDDATGRNLMILLIFGCGGVVAAMALSGAALKAIAPVDALIALALIGAALANCAAGEGGGPSMNYLYAGLDLVFVAWLLTYGLRTQRAYAVNLAFVAFGAEVIYLYFVVFGTMLQQSALFAVGGVLFLVAAYVLERVRREVTRPKPEGVH